MSINDRKTGAFRRQSKTQLTDYITEIKIQIPFENPAGGNQQDLSKTMSNGEYGSYLYRQKKKQLEIEFPKTEA